MTRPDIEITETVDSATAALIADGLSTFNAEVAGYSDHKPLAVIARDAASGAVIGGAMGETHQLVPGPWWVSPTLRVTASAIHRLLGMGVYTEHP